MVNAFGVTGYDGDFRKVCETTVRVMRANGGLLMNVLEAFLHDPLVEWRTSNSANRQSRRPAVGSVALSQKRLAHGAHHAGSEGVNENAKRIIHRVGQRLKGLYQSKLDLLFHDEEFKRYGARVRARVPSFANDGNASGHGGKLFEGSTATYLANRLPLSVEGQVRSVHIWQ